MPRYLSDDSWRTVWRIVRFDYDDCLLHAMIIMSSPLSLIVPVSRNGRLADSSKRRIYAENNTKC